MASKRRIRRKQCEGKQRHKTQTSAVRHKISLERDEGLFTDKRRTYKCQFCKGWHVGHFKHG